MGYYKQLNKNLKTVLTMLDENQLLKKLLVYDGSTPLDESNPDINSSIILEKILPYPKRDDTEDDKTSYISVCPKDSTMVRRNEFFRDADIIIEIACHIDVWAIREGYRPLLIMEEVDNVFKNNKNIESVGGIEFKSSIPTKFNNKFYGYTMVFKLTNSSKWSCGKNE